MRLNAEPPIWSVARVVGHYAANKSRKGPDSPTPRARWFIKLSEWPANVARSSTHNTSKGIVMTIRFSSIVLISSLSFAAIAQDDPALDSDEKKLSYAVGLQIGQNLKSQGVPIDVDALTLAIKDVLTEQDIRLSVEEMQSVVSTYQQKAAEERGAAGDANKKAGDEFLASNKAKEGVVELPSGLQYKVIEEGSGKQPKPEGAITVHYRGSLLDGNEFDSSYARGEPAKLQLGQVIKGWQEALPLMKEGSKWQIYVPAELAYGDRGAGGTIGPNSTLIFDIELISVE